MTTHACPKCHRVLGYAWLSKPGPCPNCDSQMREPTEAQLRTHQADRERYRFIDREGRPLRDPKAPEPSTADLDRELALVFDGYKQSFGDDHAVKEFVDFAVASFMRAGQIPSGDVKHLVRFYLEQAKRLIDGFDLDMKKDLHFDDCPACGRDFYPDSRP